MTRVLIACIGNIFMGDDAFGVEVARALARRPLPRGVRAVDFGIRGIDLAYALERDCEAAILVDAVKRGGEAGTLYVIDPELEPSSILQASLNAHRLDPAAVLGWVRALGASAPTLRVLGCEPDRIPEGDELSGELSAKVAAAIEPAAALAVRLARELLERLDHAEVG